MLRSRDRLSTDDVRIAIFCPSYGALGGIETIAVSLVAEFRRCDHTVLILARNHPAAVPSCEDTPVVNLPFHQFPRRPRHVARHVRFVRGFAPTIAALRRALRHWRADVLLTLSISAYSPYILGLAGTTPVTLGLQGGEPGGSFAANPRIFRWVLHRAARVTACATSLARAALALAPDLGARLRVIPNGVDPDRFVAGPVFPHERPYILAAGRLTRQKGFDVLLDALHGLGDADVGVDVLIAGDGPERTALLAQRDRLGLARRVHFVGPANMSSIPALYRGARFIVCPSRWEGLPLVCLEAMASERAVIATAVDGIPDAVLDGRTGILVPAEDSTALGTAIASLLGAPDRCIQLGQHGRQRVHEHFTWRRIGRQYTDLFAEIHQEQAVAG